MLFTFRRKCGFLIVWVMALLFPYSLPAQERSLSSIVPPRLTLELAAEILLQRNPELLRERQNLTIMRANIMQAGLRPNPEFELGSESYPVFTSSPGPFFQRQELTARFGYTFETSRKRSKRTQVAELELAVAQPSLQDTVRQLRLELRRRYYSVLLAKANLALAQEGLAQFDEIIRLNEVRYRQGEISGLDLARVQTERLRFFSDSLEAELQLRNAKVALLELFGAPDMTVDFDVAETLEFRAFSEELPELLTAAFDARPDILAQRQRLELDRGQITLEEAQGTPDVQSFFGYKRNERDNTVVLGVTVPLPFFNRNQGNIARANAELKQEQFELQRVELAARREIHQAYLTVKAQEERVRSLETTYVVSARRVQEISQVSYRLGTLDLIGFLDAQRAFRETLRTYNQALHDYQVAVFELQSAAGTER